MADSFVFCGASHDDNNNVMEARKYEEARLLCRHRNVLLCAQVASRSPKWREKDESLTEIRIKPITRRSCFVFLRDCYVYQHYVLREFLWLCASDLLFLY
jgi:hypothetical protein